MKISLEASRLPRKSDLYLKDILECIETIEQQSPTLEKLESTRFFRDGIVRNLEIIGEAVSQIPDEIKEAHPEVPWTKIKNFRNAAIHKYRSIDTDVVWDIIQNKLTALKEQVQDILNGPGRI
ncbi:MAG: DUF86 domain-containing protein [Candidatus Woesearchaeota archaeon]|nr:DUF86 domain-containing protein [Candidatus Woesearchaeota archaeon]